MARSGHDGDFEVAREAADHGLERATHIGRHSNSEYLKTGLPFRI